MKESTRQMSDSEEVTTEEKERVSVLLVEDNPADGLLVRTMLNQGPGERFQFTTAETLTEALEALDEAEFDIVLLDLSLPDSHGLDTFSVICSRSPTTPIIVMSGLDDERVAMSAVHAGAQDYLVKGQVDEMLLHRAVRYAIERKTVEQALRESEAFYQSLVEHLPQNILRKDTNGKFTFANQKFCAELGLPLSEIIGKTDFDFFPPPLAAKYQEDDRLVMTTGKIHETVEEHNPPGGHTVYVQTVKTAIYDETGQVIGTQIIFWDVTEKTLAEETLRNAHAELAKSKDELLHALADLQRSHNELKKAQLQLIDMEKMQTVGQLAAGIAHEVKNPLAVLRMGIEFLTNTAAAENEDNKQVLVDMNDAIHRADTIIMGLLDFSAQRTLELRGFELSGLIKDTLNLVRHDLALAKVEFETDLAKGLPEALGDPNKIKQVLINLFTNAVHAMPDGGTLRVTTKITQHMDDMEANPEGTRETAFHQADDTDLVCEIEDTGSGIPEDKIKRVFDPFFTTKSAGKGTGLGLSVAKKIVELHHGTLSIKNKAPNGVRATLTLRTKRKTND